MRPQLLHLSGPLRGRTVTYDDDALVVGSSPSAELRLDDPAVSPHHAVLEYHEADCAFVLRRIDGKLFVNRSEVAEVVLHDGDLIEWGQDGPRSRFRIYVPEGAVCKPVRRMLADARDVSSASGGVAAAGGLTRDLLTQATPQLKIGFPLLVLALALPLAWLAGWLGSRPAREGLSAASVAQQELERLRVVQDQQAAEIARLSRSNAVFADVQKRLSKGVCLVHGVVRMRWPNGGSVLDEHGDPLVLEYTGSGFLASADGRVLTNRHVVTPWEVLPQLQIAARRGGLAQFERLTATFPGGEPILVDPAQIRRRNDDLDVAMFALPAERVNGLPVLPLHDGPLDQLADQRAIVVGYPTGLAALLAKADAPLVASLQRAGASMAEVIDALAANNRISPTITEGTVGNVQERMLVYDAATTQGGSGGPVFGGDGTVIAVNYAVLREFTGANFGVPIAFGKELLAP